MSITIHPPLEDELRTKANAEGISVEAYLRRLLQLERNAVRELESLATEGITSGEGVAVGPAYWEEKHRRLEERLRNQSR